MARPRKDGGLLFGAVVVARPSGDRRGRRLPAVFRAYPPGAVLAMELDGATDLPAVCVGLKPDREDAGLASSGAGTWGPFLSSGIESGACSASVPVRAANSFLSFRQCQIEWKGGTP